MPLHLLRCSSPDGGYAQSDSLPDSLPVSSLSMLLRQLTIFAITSLVLVVFTSTTACVDESSVNEFAQNSDATSSERLTTDDAPSFQETFQDDSNQNDSDDRQTTVPAGPIELVVPEAWVLSGNDPFPDHFDDQIQCTAAAFYPEYGGTEIDTTACNYLNLEQTIQSPIKKEESVDILLWWNALASQEPAQAHLALFLDDDQIWEEYVDIPSDADIRDISIPSPVETSPASTFTFHLHNHGYNSYQLAQIRLSSEH